MTTFVWKIPSWTISQKQLLCHGYIRENCGKYQILPIVHLFACYYHEESFTLQDIQNATNLQLFVSPIFEYESLKWYLELHPNGSNIENKGSVILYLCLIMIPKNTLKISISFELKLKETDTKFRRIKTFDKKKWYMGWRRDALSFDKIKNLNTLTFAVDMDMISIKSINPETKLHKTGKKGENKYELSSISTAPVSYKWRIGDLLNVNKIRSAQTSEHFNGPIMAYGPFKWYIQFIPKQSKMKSPWIGFRIWYCPSNVYKCLCKINMAFNELSLWKSTYKLFEEKSLLTVWAATFNDRQFEQFSKLNSYSFTVDVSIIDIIYNNHNNQPLPVYNKLFRPVTMDNLASFEYEWKISDVEQLENISSAANVYSFISDIFCDNIFGLKWYLSLWPNGSRESRTGTVNIFLLLVSFKDEMMRVPIKFELHWLESNKICGEYQMYTIDQCCGGETIWPLKTQDIKHLNSLTIKLKIYIADIIGDCNCKSLLNSSSPSSTGCAAAVTVPVPTQSFEWKFSQKLLNEMKAWTLTRGQRSERFIMYGMEWFIMFYPNGEKTENANHTVLCIHLLSLPIHKLYIESVLISVRYIIFIQETNTKFAGEATLRSTQMESSWDTERISTKRFRNLNSFTIKLDIQLIDVFVTLTNKKHYRITNRFLSKEFKNKLKYHPTVNYMHYINKLEIDELEYVIASLNTLNNEFDDIDMDNNHNQNDNECEYDQVKNWFFHKAKMPQYYPMFIEAGIDTLIMIKLLNKNDLMQIGVSNVSHITKFLIEIAILNFLL